MNPIEGGVTAPVGFRAAGVAAAIKPNSTRKDCALLVSDGPAEVAGVFTRNRVQAAPVHWCREVCRGGTARAVFINSGNANACTGPLGEADTERTAALVAAGLSLSPNHVCVCSTGVIGTPLPMDRIARGIEDCIARLSPEGGGDAAAAIMTTDTVPKERAVEVPLVQGRIRIGAMAKGAGMLAPNMATMLAFLTTDAKVEAGPLRELLQQAVDKSFNSICVDNDTSTNDTVLCLANGMADAPLLVPGTPDFIAFGEALSEVCRALARDLVRDGEGATKFITIEVTGAADDEAARRVARAVAQSQLCKTAFFGNDANWGRIACAAGYAGVDLDPNRLDIWLDDVPVMTQGHRGDYREEDAADRVGRAEFSVRLQVGDGPGTCTFWTSDLSLDYVRINAEYRS